ncbi:MAG: hypothetical protein ACC657_14115 [Thiohalomonadales bacterium]
MEEFYKKIFFRWFVIIVILSKLSFANCQEETSQFTITHENDLSTIVKKIKQLSKKNELLKRRIHSENIKQDEIISKIVKLTANVELKIKEPDDTNAMNNDMLTENDFYDTSDSVIRKCSSITKAYYERESLQERQYNKILYESETLDSEWTSEVSISISNNLENRFPDTEVVSIECRTSLCEINLKHEDDLAREDFDINFDPTNRWNIIDTQSREDIISNASFISILISRNGQSIPQN